MSDSPPSPTSSLPTESPSVTASQQPSNGGLGGGTSNLYLVTFLATLFLLLFVSCAIVLRSYILRRRYQRRLEEAMASGLLLAPRAQGSKRKRFGAKPKLFDARLSHTGSRWKDLMPLAAQPVFVKRKFKEPTPKQPPTATTPVNSSDTPAPLSADASDGNLPNSIRPFTLQELTDLASQANRQHTQQQIGRDRFLDFLQVSPDDPMLREPVPPPTRRSPWAWFATRNRSNNPSATQPDDLDADDDDYDLPPVPSPTTPNPPPSLFAPSPSNRNPSPARTGPVTLTHAYLSAGSSSTAPNLNLNSNRASTGLDPAALRAAAAAGAVPGGSMPLGVMPVVGAPAGTYKVRVEMLQVTTLIAMPCPPGRDGKSRVKRIRRSKAFAKPVAKGKDLEDDEGTESDDDEEYYEEEFYDEKEEQHKPLPELVFGVARVNHNSNKAGQVGLVGRMKEF